MTQFWLFTGFPDEFIKTPDGVLAVLFLRAIFFGFDDEDSVSGDAFPRKLDQPSLYV